MRLISATALQDAKDHASREFPKESCGLLVDGAYLPCFNYATDPEADFEIASAIWIKIKAKGGIIEAVIHSHPNAPAFPSERDMQGQIETAVPWIILSTDGERFAEPTIWGDIIPPILGRSFMHGVTDCYSIIQDCFALGHDELAKQGVEWPFKPQIIKSFPRNDSWWEGEDDFYEKRHQEAGFSKIDRTEAQPGDVYFCKIRSTKMNHGGVLVGGGMILHHLPQRLSRREPSGIWGRAAEMWVRKDDAIYA